jgi:hypothetical protein
MMNSACGLKDLTEATEPLGVFSVDMLCCGDTAIGDADVPTSGVALSCNILRHNVKSS